MSALSGMMWQIDVYKRQLQTCLEMLEKNTGYQNFEIIIVENNSTTDEIFRYYKELSGNRKIHLLRWGKEFNYSAINNFAAAHAKGEYLLFLNNDVKSINPDWLEEMLGVCQRPEVGGVGAKLIYPDNTIQHAGCVIGMGAVSYTHLDVYKRQVLAELQDTVLSSRREVPPDIVTELSVHRITVRLQLPA